MALTPRQCRAVVKLLASMPEPEAEVIETVPEATRIALHRAGVIDASGNLTRAKKTFGVEPRLAAT